MTAVMRSRPVLVARCTVNVYSSSGSSVPTTAPACQPRVTKPLPESVRPAGSGRPHGVASPREVIQGNRRSRRAVCVTAGCSSPAPSTGRAAFRRRPQRRPPAPSDGHGDAVAGGAEERPARRRGRPGRLDPLRARSRPARRPLPRRSRRRTRSAQASWSWSRIPRTRCRRTRPRSSSTVATSSRRTSSSPCRHTPRRQPRPPSTRSSSRTSRPALRSATRSKAEPLPSASPASRPRRSTSPRAGSGWPLRAAGCPATRPASSTPRWGTRWYR